jgi:hypothetical protein
LLSLKRDTSIKFPSRSIIASTRLVLFGPTSLQTIP